MSLPILCIRPEPGCSATVGAGAAIGLDITACPLFEIAPVAWTAPDPAAYDALLVGSANAFRHGGAQLEGLRGLKIHAVGQATADAARQAGFEVEAFGKGGLQGLLDREEARDMHFLRLAGIDRVALDIPNSVEVSEIVVYESRPLALPDSTVELLRGGGVVMLHSAVAAEHFASEIERLGLEPSTISIAALGARIAEAAGEGWARLETASTPTDAALLALVAQMCHSSPRNAGLP